MRLSVMRLSVMKYECVWSKLPRRQQQCTYANALSAVRSEVNVCTTSDISLKPNTQHCDRNRVIVTVIV